VDAHLRVLQHVQIDHVGTNAITVLSVTPLARGEDVTLRIGPSDGEQATLTARMISSQPHVLDGRVMHRVQLARADRATLSTGVDAAIHLWRSGEHIAVVLHPQATRVVNVGRGGCRLELSTGLPVGTIGTLYSGHGIDYAEPFRVGFLRERPGVSSPYVAGVEFLWLDAPASQSFRTMAARLEREHRLVGARVAETDGLPPVPGRDTISYSQ
jgi:hypothetical protein